MSAIPNLSNLSNISRLGSKGGSGAIIAILKQWASFATGGRNPQTRQAMETGGAYERTWANLT